VAGKDSIVFNGDGKSISWHFEKTIESLGTAGSGRYVFQFRNEAWRYDAAEKLKVIPTDGKSVVFLLARPATESLIELQLQEELRTFRKVSDFPE